MITHEVAEADLATLKTTAAGLKTKVTALEAKIAKDCKTAEDKKTTDCKTRASDLVTLVTEKAKLKAATVTDQTNASSYYLGMFANGKFDGKG